MRIAAYDLFQDLLCAVAQSQQLLAKQSEARVGIAIVTTTPRPGTMKGQREPTAMGQVDMATPYLPVSAQRAEIAKVINVPR